MSGRGWIMLALAWMGPAAAHHSTAAYDMFKDMTIEGTVVEYDWANPHSWIKVRTDEADGSSRVWNLEFGTPSLSIRTGWSPTTLHAGDKGRFVFHPRFDGAASGVLSLLFMPDGKVLRGASSPAGPVPGYEGRAR